MMPRNQSTAGRPMGPPRTYSPDFSGPWDIPELGQTRWGPALRAWRKARGCSAPALAQALGLAKATITAWERGTRAPDPQAEARMEALRKGGPVAVQGLAVRQALGQFEATP